MAEDLPLLAFNVIIFALFAVMAVAFIALFYFHLRAMLIVLKASQLQTAMMAFFKGELDADMRRKWGKALKWFAGTICALLVVTIAGFLLGITTI